MSPRYSWPLSLLLMTSVTACDRGGGIASLGVTVVDNTGDRVVTINGDEGRIVERALGVQRRLRRDLVIEPEAINVIAMSPLPDGGLAILDEESGVVYGDDGMLRYRFGRRGRGPGDFVSAFGLAATRRQLVVIQASQAAQAISVYESGTGRFQGAMSTPEGGDWTLRSLRGPTLYKDFPDETGPEVWSARIRGVSDSSVAILTQPRESMAAIVGDSVVRERASVLHVMTDGHIMDTLAVLSTAPSLVRTTGDERIPALFWEPLFGPRPRWGAGDGWVAFAGAYDSVITIKALTGENLGSVAVHGATMRVTEDHRTTASKLVLKYVLRAREDSRQIIGRLSIREQRQAWRRFRNYLQFSAETPVVSGLLGAGKCLLVGLFTTDTYLDGTGRIWLRLDARTGELIDVPGIQEHDVVLLAGDWRGLYGRAFDGEGQVQVVRWTFEDDRCR